MIDIKPVLRIAFYLYLLVTACAESDAGDESRGGRDPWPQSGDPGSLSDEELLQIQGTPIAAENLANHYIDAICHTAKKCCRDRGVPIPDGMCDALESNYREKIAQFADNPLVIYDEKAAGNCVERLRRSVQACQAPSQGSLCEGVFRGTLALGEVCENSMECAEPEGASTTCDEDDDVVKRCVIGGTPGPDGVRSAVGEPCTATCDVRPDGSSGCRSLIPLEATRDATTIPRYCLRQDSLRCDEAQFICVAQQPLDGPCEHTYACEVDSRCLDNFCKPLAGAFESCRTSNDCADQARCVEAVCVPAIPIGQACNDGDHCMDRATCTDGVCALRDEFIDLCEGDIG